MAHPSKSDGDTVTHSEWNAQSEEFRVKITRLQVAGPFGAASQAWNNYKIGTLTPSGTYSAVLGIYATFEMDPGFTSGGTDDYCLARFMISDVNDSGHAAGNQNVVTRFVKEQEDAGTVWYTKTVYSTFNDGDSDYEEDNNEYRQCYFPCGLDEYNIYMQFCAVDSSDGSFTNPVPDIRNVDAYIYWIDNCYLIPEQIL